MEQLQSSTVRVVNRRTFLSLLASPLFAGSKELQADIAIIGGGVGGCAAALAALRNGLRVILTEETDWLGGQLTSQGVPPDEHPWVESFGVTRSYRSWRNGVRDYYLQNYPVTAATRALTSFSPGNASVLFSCEPTASLAVLENMLAPWVVSGALTIMHLHKPVAADTSGDTVRAVTLKNLRCGSVCTISAPYIVDATETGELLPLAGIEYVTGFESRRQTGEPRAPEIAQPQNIQSITWCFSVEHLAGEDHTIDMPEDYGYWRNYIPTLTPAWPERQLSWLYTDPRTRQPSKGVFDPTGAGDPGLWIYRRTLDKNLFTPGAVRSDICAVNWPQNDYVRGSVFDVTPLEAAWHLRGAKQLSLSLLYWLQTEAPRADGGLGWPGLSLRYDQSGTDDGLCKAPYIRESRRIQAEFTITELHIGADLLRQQGKTTAEQFPDSVGVGSYRIDLHPTTYGDNYMDSSALPFRIPLGALLPKRVENLLPGCKNIGTTHITNGCYRVHPVEWNIGEAAGVLAAFCLANDVRPRQVRANPQLLSSFQTHLQHDGVELAWPQCMSS